MATAGAVGFDTAKTDAVFRLGRRSSTGLLGVSRPMIYRYIERGDLSAVRVGSHWRMRAGDVLALARRRADQAEAIDAGVAAALEAG